VREAGSSACWYVRWPRRPASAGGRIGGRLVWDAARRPAGAGGQAVRKKGWGKGPSFQFITVTIQTKHWICSSSEIPTTNSCTSKQEI
jgi:hypothetical protein